jgi:hypothetical protein
MNLDPGDQKIYDPTNPNPGDYQVSVPDPNFPIIQDMILKKPGKRRIIGLHFELDQIFKKNCLSITFSHVKKAGYIAGSGCRSTTSGSTTMINPMPSRGY